MNFVHGHPYVSVSLGFTFESRPVVGVVYNPFYHHLYSACTGKGAYLEDFRGRRRLPFKQPAAPLGKLRDSLIAVEWGKEREGVNWETTAATFKNLGAKDGGMVHDLRTFGGAALNLCTVAAGSVDGKRRTACRNTDIHILTSFSFSVLGRRLGCMGSSWVDADISVFAAAD
jgi:myo-inositol-1(or 4)-monophosphatase